MDMDVDNRTYAAGDGTATPNSADAFFQIRLITKSPKFAVPDVAYSVPSSTRSPDLNSLLNQLLSDNAEEWTEVQFDFLIDGEVLSESIGEYAAKKAVSSESVISVEYIEHLPAPKPDQSIEHSDWVSALHMLNDVILTGSYDKTVSLWSRSGSLLCRNESHLSPIRAVTFVDESNFLSSSHDQTAALWYLEKQGKKLSCRPQAFYRGHAGSVDGLSVSPDKQRFCSVSWDKMLKIWSLTEEADEGVGSDGEPADKKQKIDGKKLTRVPLMTLSGHKEAVSTCVWTNPTEIITASWDHTIKLWDVELGGLSRQIDGSKAYLSIAYSHLNRLLVTGATDRLIRLFDPRSTEGSIVKTGFSSHMGWVSSVSWSPLNENLFISGSYDMVLKMWDIRSPKSPVYDMAGHADKILCAFWSQNNLLLSGGADNAVKVFNAAV